MRSPIGRHLNPNRSHPADSNKCRTWRTHGVIVSRERRGFASGCTCSRFAAEPPCRGVGRHHYAVAFARAARCGCVSPSFAPSWLSATNRQWTATETMREAACSSSHRRMRTIIFRTPPAGELRCRYGRSYRQGRAALPANNVARRSGPSAEVAAACLAPAVPIFSTCCRNCCSVSMGARRKLNRS
jgi:hypothetical protein